MPRLTKASVAALPTTGKRYEVSDDSLSGFYVRVNAGGSKTPIVRYSKDGRLKSLTLKPLSDAFSPWRTTSETYERLVARYIVPAFGSLAVTAITRTDVERLHQSIGAEKPGSANRVLAVLSGIFNKAGDWSYVPAQSNPCRGVRKFRENKVERFLTAAERASLESALVESESSRRGATKAAGDERVGTYVGAGALAAIRLLVLTGCRCSEILGLRWSSVDLDRAVLALPDSKTGARAVPLSEQAIAYLRQLERQSGSSPWVCTNEAGNRVENIERAWRSIRHRAGLDDVRLHDLRHSWASDAIAAKVPLAVVQVVLGHSDIATTMRYVHLHSEDLREGVNAAGDRIASRSKPT